MLSELSDEEIQQMINQYIKDQIAGLERIYYDSSNPPFRSAHDYHAHVGSLDYYKKRTVEFLGMGD